MAPSVGRLGEIDALLVIAQNPILFVSFRKEFHLATGILNVLMVPPHVKEHRFQAREFAVDRGLAGGRYLS